MARSTAFCWRASTSLTSWSRTWGADLAATFCREDLIDEPVLKVNPVLFGSGIPLVAGAIHQRALQLVDSM
jgi:dihydrofolate reductase